jgi:hypothetical protein
MLTLRTICAAVIIGAILTLSSVSYAYASDPPAIPSFGLLEAPATETTTTATTTNEAAASSTATATSSGPANVVVIIGLVLLAVLSLKKYSQIKKHNL